MKVMQASFTVEAAVVMSVVLLTIGSLIQGAFRMHDQVRGAIYLYQEVEVARRRQDGEITAVAPPSFPRFFYPPPYMEIKPSLGTVKGSMGMMEWEKEIQIRVYEPEEFLRLLEAAGL